MPTLTRTTLRAGLLSALSSLALLAGCSGSSPTGPDATAGLGESRQAVTVSSNLDCSGSSTKTMYLADTLTLTASSGCTVVKSTPIGIFSNPVMVDGMAVPSGGFSVSPTTTGTKTFTFQNSAGTSTETLTLTVLDNPALPPAPTITVVTPGNAQVAVTVVAAPIGTVPDDFLVTASPGGGTCTVGSPSGSPKSGSCTVTGLTNRTAYTFTAVARTAYGSSKASNAMQATPDVDVDGDGLFSRFELALGTPDNEADPDEDGLCDGPVSLPPKCRAGEDLNANGVVDAWESDPAKSDTDGDGIKDHFECDQNLAPVDTDGDGINDFRDLDSDGDGLTDQVETKADFDGDGIPNFRDLDSDSDGATDAQEGATADTDGDGRKDFLDLDDDNDELTREDEAFFGTNPLVSDRPANYTQGFVFPGWKTNRLLAVDHSAAGAQDLTDFQVRFYLDTTAEVAAGRMKPDCSDLRVVLGDGCSTTDADFWVADGTCNTNKTLLFVKYGSIRKNQKSFVGLYWNNLAAARRSNGTATFPEFFDDFNGASLDTSKWNVLGNGTHGIVNGRLQNSGGAKAIWTKNGAVVRAGQTVFGVGTDAQSVAGADIEYGAAALAPSYTNAANLHFPTRQYTGVTWMAWNHSAAFIGRGTSGGSCSVDTNVGSKWTNDPGDFTVFQTEFFYTLNPANSAVTFGIYDKFGQKRSITRGNSGCTAPAQNSAYWQFDHEQSGTAALDPTTSIDYAYVRKFAEVDPVSVPGWFLPDGDDDRDGISNVVEMCKDITDSDGDGTLDYLDLDSDGDGEPDLAERDVDTDGDGIYDARDTDSDNDGLLDMDEGYTDFDGDGIPNHHDLDSDNDGLLDADEGFGNPDGDKLSNLWDLDSDGDGLSDTLEGLTDTDGDGVKDFLDTDADGDGLPDALENRNDNDNDGLVDWKDPDCDADGIIDGFEAGFTRLGQALLNASLTNMNSPDTDGDGLCDGHRSIPGVCEAGEDLDENGLWTVGEETHPLWRDTDRDGVEDGLELGWNGTSLSTPIDDLPATYRFLSFTSDNCVAVNADPHVGDDRGGLAVTPTSVIMTGDKATAWFDPSTLTLQFKTSPTNDEQAIHSGLISDLKSRTAFVMGNSNGKLAKDDLRSNLITHLYPLDPNGQVASSPVVLSQAVQLDSDASKNFSFSGYEFGVIAANTTLYVIEYATGAVEIRSMSAAIPGNDSESALAFGVASRRDGKISLFFGKEESSNDAVFRLDVETGALSQMSAFTGSQGQLANIAVDVKRKRWYQHIESLSGSSPFGVAGTSLAESLGACDLAVKVTIQNPALYADFDQDGLCDGPVAACTPSTCRQGDEGVNCLGGEDLDADGIVDATESDPANKDTDGDTIGDKREFTDPANVDGDAQPNFVDLDSDNDGLPDALELTADTDGDGLPNYLDTDSDSDGLTDTAELANADSDNDGVLDRLDTDSDNDGLPDGLETLVDTDGDGVTDAHDLDSDNDGILDNVEMGRTQSGAAITGATLTNRLDADSDDDGLCDGTGAVPGVCTAGEDLDNNGTWTVGLETHPKRADTDGDGMGDGVELGWDGVRGSALPVPVEQLITRKFKVEPGVFTADNCRSVDHDSLTGDDRAGIAVSPSLFYVTGDTATGFLDPNTLATVGSTGNDASMRFDGLVTDLKTRTVYVLGDANGRLACPAAPNAQTTNCPAFGGSVTRLIPLDASGNEQPAAAVTLSVPVSLATANASSSGRYLFSGEGFAVISLDDANGTTATAYKLEFASGKVTQLALPRRPGDFGSTQSEGIFSYGVGAYSSEDLVLLIPGYFYTSGSSGDAVFAWNTVQDTDQVVSGPIGLSYQLANITMDVQRARWYWHTESSVIGPPVQGVKEGAGYCDLRVEVTNHNRALFADFDKDGLCDGPRDVCTAVGLGCLQGDGFSTCIGGEDLNGNLVVEATESDALNPDSDGDGIGDKREYTDAADVDTDGTPNYRDLDSDDDNLPDSYELTADTDGDGLPDYLDVDSDGDGLLDKDEVQVDTDADGIPDYRDADGDNDGLSDMLEGRGDFDGDGIVDALDLDSDNDGIPDNLEEGVTSAGLVIPGATLTNRLNPDSDGDGLCDGSRSVPSVCAAGEDLNNNGLREPESETDPKSRDTDGDGVEDGIELGWDGVALRAPADTLVRHEVQGFTAQNCQVVEHVVVTGDDRGGIALSPTTVYVTGDAATGFFSPETLDVLGSTKPSGDEAATHSAMVSDLLSQQVYVLAGANGKLALSELSGGTVTQLLPLDSVGAVMASHPVVLSQSITLSAAAAETFLFSGAGFAAIAVGTDVYEVEFASGTVTQMALQAAVPGNSAESALQFGVAQKGNGGVQLFYGATDSDGLNRIAVLDVATGNSAYVSEPLGMGDPLASLTVDLARGRWYWHQQGVNGKTEALGVCDLQVKRTNDSRALRPDYDEDGLCDGDGTVAGVCIPGEDLDGDGTVDATESDPLVADTDGDGIGDRREHVDPADVDGDGVPNKVDTDSDADGLTDAFEGTVDTDSDGFPDYLDADGDNDGLSDTLEGGTADTDNDGTPDFRDTDSDGDGVLDATEGENTGGVAVDTDNDGKPDYLDTDSDNDGVLDVLEAPAGVKADADGDGIPDMRDTDADNDGLSDTDEVPLGLPLDTDGDGTPDFADVDADNDGISDTMEAPGGVHVDTDNDGIPNHHDTDSDNDGVLDATEAGDLDFQTAPVDTDGDSTPDYLDTDSDNDGSTDTQESDGAHPVDSDGDGTADFLDSDNDGVLDATEVVTSTSRPPPWTRTGTAHRTTWTPTRTTTEAPTRRSPTARTPWTRTGTGRRTSWTATATTTACPTGWRRTATAPSRTRTATARRTSGTSTRTTTG